MMDKLYSLRGELINRLLKRVNFEEIERDPFSYAFIYWILYKNRVKIKIVYDIENYVKLWVEKFVSNPNINVFLDRNVAAAIFLFNKNFLEEEKIKKIFPIIVKNFDYDKKVFFKSVFYTVIILEMTKKLKVDNEKLLEQLKIAQENLYSLVERGTILNDPKIFPLLAKVLEKNEKLNFFEQIKYKASNPQEITDQDKIFYAWTLLVYRDLLEYPDFKKVYNFLEETVLTIEGLLKTFKSETLEKLYGKDIREELSLYWLGCSYDLINEAEKFLRITFYDLRDRLRHFLLFYELHDMYQYFKKAEEKLKEATLLEDETQQRMLSTDAVYYLGKMLEGVLKFIYWKVSMKKEESSGEKDLSITIGRLIGKLKGRGFFNKNESIYKLSKFLTDEFRNIAAHYELDKEKLKEGKFKPIYKNLVDAKLCLGLTETLTCCLLEKLETKLAK